MKTITRISISLLISTPLLFSNPVLARNGYGKQKVVYHINYDSPKRQAGAMRNIQNHINAVGTDSWTSRSSCTAKA